MIHSGELWTYQRRICSGRCAAISILLLVLGFGISACSKYGLSGQYIANTPMAVARLQLVETPDNRLSGQIEVSTLQPDGKIKYVNSAVTGAADGPNVSLTLESTSPLLNSVQVSGTFSLNGLTLTGGFTGSHSSTFVLHSGNLNQYHAALAILNKRSVALLEAHKAMERKAAIAAKNAAIATAAAARREKALQEQQSFAQNVEILCDKMQKFETAGNATLQKFPAITAKYQMITTKMEGYLQRDRIFAGDARASYARSQISYTMGNGISKTNQIHFEVQSLQDSFMSNVEPQMQSAINAMRICNNTSVPVATVTPACERLRGLYPKYSKTYRDIVAGLSNLEATYKTELRKQNRLKTEADQIN